MNDHRDPLPDHAALEAAGLGRRYRRGWALRSCDLRIPAGRVCALVGPNGAGKSTFLSLAGGLLNPTHGQVRVFGQDAGTPHARNTTALLSQDKPLYRGFRVEEILRLGAELNPTWHHDTAQRILDQGSIPLRARISTLSGGQRTRVALALAFGKRPRLLMLDEPMADLDPLVRHEVTALLREEAATHGTTVLLSSHVVGELAGLCDYAAVISSGTVRLTGPIDELRAAHRAIPAGDPPPDGELITRLPTENTTIVRADADAENADLGSTPTLEQLLMAYLHTPAPEPFLTPDARPRTRRTRTQ
ncbi:ABC transporter ATP-binding protein [Streptomyces erythrochromogenes]|uniref:ABC transporter ATP-binding protein n=1 Tax=Streptomyces erythrochromogenes TaxID=285574 RepID=UPI00341D5CF5